MNIAVDHMDDEAIVALNGQELDSVAGGLFCSLFFSFVCKPVYYNPCRPVKPRPPVNTCQPKPPCPTGTCGPTRP
ncbi:MAG: hypothetical protein ACK5LJ_18375 [Paracoccus sp. (in: a-proteobacteria)]